MATWALLAALFSALSAPSTNLAGCCAADAAAPPELEWRGEACRECAREHVLLQRSLHRLSRAAGDVLQPSTGSLCHTATKDESCYKHVMWAKHFGIRAQPTWYPGLTRESGFEEFQSLLHTRGQHGCPRPCTLGARPYASAGCRSLSEEQCCLHRDGQPEWHGEDCVVVRNVTAPEHDIEVLCQPQAWVAGGTAWRGLVVGCPSPSSSTRAPAATTTTTTSKAADHAVGRQRGMCAAFGDPHFITFDGGHTVFVGARVFWLVKTDRVWIQGLSKDSEGKLMGIAVGGPFMGGHRLILRKVSNASISAEFDGESVMREPVDEFHVAHVVEGVREEKWEIGFHNEDILKMRTERPFDVGPWPARFLRPPRGGIYVFYFQRGVEVTVTGVDYMSVVVTMPPQPTGHGGYCGNFNGSPEDDAEPVVPSWNRPVGPGLEPVPEASSLFQVASQDDKDGAVDDGRRGQSEPGATSDWRASLSYHGAVSRETLLRRVVQFESCPPELWELAVLRCSEVMDGRIREDCVFDVCTTGNVNASEDAVAAEVLQGKAVGAESLLGVQQRTLM